MDKSDKRSISGNAPGKQEGSTSAKKLDLSVAQVLGSAVAAVVAAFAAGQLGVYGTFLGAGVVSLVATSGGPIFQHFFSRTGEQLKEVTVPPKARQVPVRDPAAGWKPESADGTRVLPNAAATQALRTDDATRMLHGDDATRMLRRDDATRVLGTVKRPAGADGAQEHAGERAADRPEGLPGNGEFTPATTHGTKWRGWRRTLLPAVVVFVIAIGGITLYEAISGHSVSGGKGTSLSDVLRPGHGSSTGNSPEGSDATPTPESSQDGESPTPTPESSQQSTDPSDSGSSESGSTDSGDSGKSTPTPDPSPSQPGGTQDPGSTDTGTGDTSGSDSQNGTEAPQSDSAGSGSQPSQG
ncbi:hypothetical protein ITI46_00710 [Streptomyces oryzae]|uniref:Uncharacterized protein n=1 Tax=Streptomyces oryzae TaxID=1434886 RepID=A0ABS3X4F3_9ACTN|nr:hypothetical protein [Streptomyces oryzae]MBO8190247.1 hypothetical protein [Streptomyces oryzae]